MATSHGSFGAESGQAMTEFALVLPILALLTFGTLEVAIYLQQQSTMNAAAFIAARSGSVLGNVKGPTAESVGKFADGTGMSWLKTAVGSMKNAPAQGRSRYALEARTDNLTGLVSALSGGSMTGMDTLTAQVTLPLEYDYRTLEGHTANVTYKPKTHFQISYASKEKKALVDHAGLEKLKDFRDKAKAFLDKWPKDSPIKPPASLQVLANLPVSKDSEPYSNRPAVIPNPKGVGTSKGYLAHDYEDQGQGGYKIKDLDKDLKDYADSLGSGGAKEGLRKVCVAIREFPPATMPPPVTAAHIAVIKPWFDKLKAPVAGWAGAAEKAAASAYKEKLGQEKELFGR